MDESKFTEMYSDIKVLVSEFRAMNGTLNNTKQEIKEHIKESTPYRKKIDELWAGIQFSKWIVMLIFGTGLLFNLIKWVFK